MTIPSGDEQYAISRVLPVIQETLNYCAREALLSAEPGALAYDGATDEVIYHLNVKEMDRELFDLLHGVEEIWIITRAGVES